VTLRAGAAIVTGAGSGIGRALAHELTTRGEGVVLVDRDATTVAEATSALSVTGAEVRCATADITVPDALAEAVALAAEVGHLQTACLNAGITTTGTTTWETPSEVFDLVLRVNLRGLHESVRTVVPAMLAHGQPGRILITASMAGVVASPLSAGYAASKAGAIAVAKALRSELATVAPRISVTVLNPGMVRTNLMHTSSAWHRHIAGMPDEVVTAGHTALNSLGISPEQAAREALDDVDAGRFWSLPGKDDPFVAAMHEEIAELTGSMTARLPRREQRW
jgi:short-subunit dehydrogenase